MAKYYESQTVFNYNMDQVLQGFWRRYPNPYSMHVLTEDTVEREIRPDGKLYTKRLLTKTNKLPKWAEKIFSHVKQVCIVEESIVDVRTKTLTTYTRNVGLNKIMSVVEKVTYNADPQGHRTIAHRTAVIDSKVFGLAAPIKAFGCERFKKNCQKSILGFNYVLGILFPMHNNAPLVQPDVKQKFKEAAKHVTDHVKEQIYEASHIKINQN